MDEIQGVPIRVVVGRTGLSAHVLRVWERRYGAVEPIRTPTNRRLYTEADVGRLQALQRAIAAGHSIGQIARLPIAAIEVLSATGTEGPIDLAVPPPTGTVSALALETSREAYEYVEASIAAIQRLDGASLEAELSRAAVDLGHAPLVERVVQPLMQRIDELWEAGTLRMADEHLASAVVKSFLGSLRSSLRISASAPQIVVTTPAGQVHEIGAMLFATIASFEGWRVTYLGPDLPAEEIAGAARHGGVRAVALSIVYPADDPRLGPELTRLRSYLDEHIAILIGGRASRFYASFIDAIGAAQTQSLTEARKLLDQLRHLPPA